MYIYTWIHRKVDINAAPCSCSKSPTLWRAIISDHAIAVKPRPSARSIASACRVGAMSIFAASSCLLAQTSAKGVMPFWFVTAQFAE